MFTTITFACQVGANIASISQFSHQRLKDFSYRSKKHDFRFSHNPKNTNFWILKLGPIYSPTSSEIRNFSRMSATRMRLASERFIMVRWSLPLLCRFSWPDEPGSILSLISIYFYCFVSLSGWEIRDAVIFCKWVFWVSSEDEKGWREIEDERCSEGSQFWFSIFWKAVFFLFCS